MGSNRLPYFPFHAGDWVTDEAVAGMSAEAEGCYIRLLARSWMSGTPGVVPVGLVNELGGLYRVNERSTVVQQELERAFDTESRPGYWVQDRMVREWERAVSVSEAGRKAGLASVEARKSKKVNGRSTVVERSFNQGEVEVDLETEESKNPPTPRSPKRARDDFSGMELPDSIPSESWKDWCGFRSGLGSRYPWTKKAAELCVGELVKLDRAGFPAKEVIGQSILSGWRGLFPLKDQPAKNEPESDGWEVTR